MSVDPLHLTWPQVHFRSFSYQRILDSWNFFDIFFSYWSILCSHFLSIHLKYFHVINIKSPFFNFSHSWGVSRTSLWSDYTVRPKNFVFWAIEHFNWFLHVFCNLTGRFLKPNNQIKAKKKGYIYCRKEEFHGKSFRQAPLTSISEKKISPPFQDYWTRCK